MRNPTLPKHLVNCCGMVCAQGEPVAWECPACGTLHEPPEGGNEPAPYIPQMPSALAAPALPFIR